tara:strand:+ start:1533 stop:1907 length:375 start_codon:yes stop_codon:yes gene_type:complete
METITKGDWQGFLGMGLSRRELEFTLSLCFGMTDKQMAREAGIAPDTVHKRLNRARDKLKASNRAELLAKAIRMHIIKPLLLLIVFAMTAVQATPDHQPVTRNRIVRVKGGARRDADVSVFRIC